MKYVQITNTDEPLIINPGDGFVEVLVAEITSAEDGAICWAYVTVKCEGPNSARVEIKINASGAEETRQSSRVSVEDGKWAELSCVSAKALSTGSATFLIAVQCFGAPVSVHYFDNDLQAPSTKALIVDGFVAG